MTWSEIKLPVTTHWHNYLLLSLFRLKTAVSSVCMSKTKRPSLDVYLNSKRKRNKEVVVPWCDYIVWSFFRPLVNIAVVQRRLRLPTWFCIWNDHWRRNPLSVILILDRSLEIILSLTTAVQYVITNCHSIEHPLYRMKLHVLFWRLVSKFN